MCTLYQYFYTAGFSCLATRVRSVLQLKEKKILLFLLLERDKWEQKNAKCSSPLTSPKSIAPGQEDAYGRTFSFLPTILPHLATTNWLIFCQLRALPKLAERVQRGRGVLGQRGREDESVRLYDLAKAGDMSSKCLQSGVIDSFSSSAYKRSNKVGWEE